MSLAPGARLGPYEIVAVLGAGGMGEVYRARDSRLKRDVAIKVIRTDEAPDADRLRRFEQEAQATAALNHPNILAIYDVGLSDPSTVRESQGRPVPYIVSELLEGHSLRSRMDEGTPWPVRSALDVATQVARGLGAAHGRGIVHRDLKPENVFVTKDGVVKILDFGLAKLRTEGASSAGEAGGADSAGAAREDRATTMTGEHAVLGTLGYMAPEQLRAEKVDHRADIFALGAMLYELLAGRRAFAGATPADTQTAILTHEPADFSSVNAIVPSSVDRLTRRCLAKSPDERFQSTRDLVFALEALSSLDTSAGSSAVDAARPASLSKR